MRSTISQPLTENSVTEAKVELSDVLPAYVDVRPLEAEGTVTNAFWREATDEKTAKTALKSALANIPVAALQAALQDPDNFTPVNLMTWKDDRPLRPFENTCRPGRKRFRDVAH